MSNTSKTGPVQSASFLIQPIDARCKYWAKKVAANTPLPLPSEVDGANDIPSPYLRQGDEELMPGDFLFEGEANHHRRNRGWSYWISFVDSAGEVHRFRNGFSDQKAAAKQQGMPAELLAGSGDVAGAIRVAHALRLNINLRGDLGAW